MSTHAPSPICFVDTETDGLHRGRRMWEIALIRREPDGTEDTKRMFVGIDLRDSDPYALRLGGFWDRHPAGRKISGKEPSPVDNDIVYCKHDAAKVIMRMTFDAHLVGVNPGFDADTMAGLLRSEGYLPSWHYHLIDLIPMTVGWLHADAYRHPTQGGRPLSWPTALESLRPPWSSDVLASACGVMPPTDTERHTALGDARWAMRWYDTLTAQVRV